jgi:hypothetical protein
MRWARPQAEEGGALKPFRWEEEAWWLGYNESLEPSQRDNAASLQALPEQALGTPLEGV